MYIENHHLKKSVSIWLIIMFWIIALMIVVGGLTRLTDSGLSITEWQLFSGFLPPLNESDWDKYFSSLPFNKSALALYEWAPIAEELKTLDRKIVLNSMILKWDNIKEEFEKRINF